MFTKKWRNFILRTNCNILLLVRATMSYFNYFDTENYFGIERYDIEE